MDSPHLANFFKSGFLFEFKVPNPDEPDGETAFELWFQKPNPLQQAHAMKKGKAKQARIKQLYRDESSDEYLSLKEEVVDLGGMSEIVETLARLDLPERRQKAYNEVMYSDEIGSNWGSDGGDYLDLLEAIRDRRDEIIKANEGLSEEDAHLKTSFEDDEELKRLLLEESKFEEEVAERVDLLTERDKANLSTSSLEELRDKLFKRMIEVESGMAWMEEYRIQMLFAACRTSDNHNRHYFSSIDDIWELPDFVRSRLLEAYGQIDEELDSIKNWLSPLPS